MSAWYDEHLSQSDTYHSRVVIPNLLRLMRPLAGTRTLDVACGEGQFARALAEEGAAVCGVDIAPELIALATQKHPGGSYRVGSADDLSVFADDSFDWVTMVLALQNVEKYREAIAECFRVMRRGGGCIFVMNHPAFRIPKRSAWGFDEERSVQYRRLDGYLFESRAEIAMRPGADPNAVTYSFHRPLQGYFKAIEKAGGVVIRLEEWISDKQSQPGPRAAAEDTARKEFPLFMALACTKLG